MDPTKPILSIYGRPYVNLESLLDHVEHDMFGLSSVGKERRVGCLRKYRHTLPVQPLHTYLKIIVEVFRALNYMLSLLNPPKQYSEP